MTINLKHYLFAIQAVKKSMIKNKGGSIINLGSVSWIRGAVMFPAYATAKAAIYGLTKSLARDLGQHNIRINSIAPGSVATKRQSKLWLNSKFKKEILDKLQEMNDFSLMVLDESCLALFKEDYYQAEKTIKKIEEISKYEKKLSSLELPRLKEFSRLSRNNIAINGPYEFILKLEDLLKPMKLKP